MKCCVLSTAVLAARWAMVLVCAVATAQARIDMHSHARNIDFSHAASTRPFPVGSSLPAVCAAGETYFKSDAAAGRNLYLCTSANQWTPIESGGSQAVNGGTYTGHHDFSGAASLSVTVLPDKPAVTDCDSAQRPAVLSSASAPIPEIGCSVSVPEHGNRGGVEDFHLHTWNDTACAV